MMDLDPEAKRVLALARAARSPSDDDKARVEQRLSLALGAAALAAPTAVAAKAAVAGSAAKGTTGLVALKWWLSGSALLVAAVGGYVALSAPAKVATPAPAKKTVATQVVTPEAEPAPEAPVPTAPGVDPVAQESEPHAKAREPKRPRAPEDALAAEVSLLHRAQSAWRGGQAREALTLVREHEKRFPRSELGLERDALHVLTLCELGQKPAATRLATRLLARAPSSPLRASIEESCALR